MSTLDGQARSVVEEGREGFEPNPQDEARVLARVEASIAAGVTVSLEPHGEVSGAATKTASTTGRGAMGAGTKVAFAALAVAVVGIAIYMMTNGEVRSNSATVNRAQMQVPAPAPQLPVSHTQAQAPLDSVTTNMPSSQPTVTAQETQLEAPASRVPAERSVAARHEVETSDVAAEAALLRQAQRDLNSGNPSAALVSLDAFRTRFAHGTLREEESAARVLTLCALGRTADATREARIFARRFASSPLLARVSGSCAAAQ